MYQSQSRFATLAFLSLIPGVLAGQDLPVEPKVGFANRVDDKSAYLEFIDYEQTLHSSTEGAVAGENTDFQAAFRFFVHDEGYFRVRFDTDPQKNPKENLTSKLELVMNHRLADFEIQGDLDLRFAGSDDTIGPDVDSDNTFISYKPNDVLAITLYPFNFDGDLGRYFYMNDVNRMFYIEGTPDSIPQFLPDNDDSVYMRNKTLPGVDVQYQVIPELLLTLGGGAARYLYPSDENFDIESTTTAESWEAKTNAGYKLGVDFTTEVTNIELKAVTQDNADETGALIKTAANLRVTQKIASFILGFEAAYSHAGDKAYELRDDGRWFSDRGDYAPIYADENGDKENWLGKDGAGYLLKAAYNFPKITPYIQAGLMTEHFIFTEEESAHKLRTSDSTKSHGGLKTYGFGADFKRGNYVITPEFEYFVAKNDVFFNQTDLRKSANLANRNNKESRVTVYLKYFL